MSLGRRNRFRNLLLQQGFQEEERVQKSPFEKLIQGYYEELFAGKISLSVFNELVEQAKKDYQLDEETLKEAVDVSASLPAVAERTLQRKSIDKKFLPGETSQDEEEPD